MVWLQTDENILVEVKLMDTKLFIIGMATGFTVDFLLGYLLIGTQLEGMRRLVVSLPLSIGIVLLLHGLFL